jgi:hypothetical protein
MLCTATRFDLLGSRPAGDLSNLTPYVRELGRAGFKLVLLAPGEKEPIDVRTPQMRKVDDSATQQLAKELGNPRWAEVKTRAGIQIATEDPARLAKYVERAEKQYGQPPNLAVALDRTFIAVDADWAVALKAFIEKHLTETGEKIDSTVLSPGVQNADGTWKHQGGGHIYFALPTGYTLPDGVSSLKVGAGKEEWVAFLDDRYILIPPSVRKEGPYRWQGGVQDAPMWLLKMLEDEAARLRKIATEKAARAVQRASEGPSNIELWAAPTEWSDLLESDGWDFTGCTTACGCPEATAPGTHASLKIATAHEPGCLELDTSSGHGPLHIWTDNPPLEITAYTKATGSKTMTKLQYVAWTKFGGDQAAAISALGITGGTVIGPTAAELDEDHAEEGEEGCPPSGEPDADASDSVDETDPNANADVPETPSESDDLPEAFRKRGFNPYDMELYPLGFPNDPELLEKIVNFSPITQAIFHHARDQRPKPASPVAAILGEMIRRGMRCPVNVRPFHDMPLSTYVVYAGRSGTGKTKSRRKKRRTLWPQVDPPQWLADKAATKVEAPAVKPVPPTPGVNGQPPQSGIAQPSSAPTLIPFAFDTTIGIGSGQVLVDHLTQQIPGTGERGMLAQYEMLPHPSVRISCDELTTLMRVAKGDSATIISTLCEAWAGEELGSSTRTLGARRADGDYSVFLDGGIQPKLAHEILDHDASGFLQRVAVTAVTDPYRLLGQPMIPDPGQVVAPMPTITPTSVFTLDQCVHSAVDKAIEDSDFDHLLDPDKETESHLMQVRVRLACLGALLHGTLHVDTVLWEWTGWLIEHILRSLAWLRAEQKREDDKTNNEAGQRQADIKAAITARESEKVEEVARSVRRKVTQAEAAGCTRGDIRANGVSEANRKWVDRAIALLVSRSLIYLDGTRYKLTKYKTDAQKAS